MSIISGKAGAAPFYEPSATANSRSGTLMDNQPYDSYSLKEKGSHWFGWQCPKEIVFFVLLMQRDGDILLFHLVKLYFVYSNAWILQYNPSTIAELILLRILNLPWRWLFLSHLHSISKCERHAALSLGYLIILRVACDSQSDQVWHNRDLVKWSKTACWFLTPFFHSDYDGN